MLGLIWWTIYILVAVWAQHVLPGLDFLAPGFIVSLQEDRGPATIWLAVVFILLQEGMGTLFFGSGLLNYSMLALAFFMGRMLFDSRSATLVVLLGLVIGVCHTLFSLMTLRLEGMLVPLDRLLLESLAQAVITPLLWYVVHVLFPKGLRRDERTV